LFPVSGSPASSSPVSSAAVSSSNDELEVVPGFERENLQGWIPQLATEADVRAVIEKAFDYRGDVTITRKDKNNSQKLPAISSTAVLGRVWKTPSFV
jgi:hypothetical protein